MRRGGSQGASGDLSNLLDLVVAVHFIMTPATVHMFCLLLCTDDIVNNKEIYSKKQLCGEGCDWPGAGAYDGR